MQAVRTAAIRSSPLESKLVKESISLSVLSLWEDSTWHCHKKSGFVLDGIIHCWMPWVDVALSLSLLYFLPFVAVFCPGPFSASIPVVFSPVFIGAFLVPAPPFCPSPFGMMFWIWTENMWHNGSTEWDTIDHITNVACVWQSVAGGTCSVCRVWSGLSGHVGHTARNRLHVYGIWFGTKSNRVSNTNDYCNDAIKSLTIDQLTLSHALTCLKRSL